jgi:hypothetical protein
MHTPYTIYCDVRLDRALVVINTGAWDQYCIGYGYCVPNTYTQVHRTNPQAVYAYLASQLDYLLSSTYLKPALKVYIAGYQNVVRDLNEVLQMTANKHGTAAAGLDEDRADAIIMLYSCLQVHSS